MPRQARPIDWTAFAASPDRQSWEARRAAELERLAIEEAVQRAIRQGTAQVVQPYRPRPTILANRYLPAIGTVVWLLLLNYFAQG